MKPANRILAIAAIAALTCLSRPGQAAVVFEDGNFAEADWTAITQVVIGPLSMVFAQFGQGNPPNSRRHILNVLNIAGGESAGIRAASINTVFAYDPGVSGAIGSLTFSYDLQVLQILQVNTTISGFYRPVLRQGGVVYTLQGVNDPASAVSWESFSHLSGAASQWLSVDNSSPDFSSSGGLIEFGYSVGLGLSCSAPSGVFCSTGELQGIIDNFRVSIEPAENGEPIPEPSAYLLAGSGLAAAALRRRRARA